MSETPKRYKLRLGAEVTASNGIRHISEGFSNYEYTKEKIPGANDLALLRCTLPGIIPLIVRQKDVTEIDPYAELKDAWDDGEIIEQKKENVTFFRVCRIANGCPAFDQPIENYRILKTTDPLYAIKRGYAEGLEVKYLVSDGCSYTLSDPAWDGDTESYQFGELAEKEIDPFVQLKAWYKEDGVIEYRSVSEDTWKKTTVPGWLQKAETYRRADAYRELKEAHAAGKIIEYLSSCDHWVPLVNPKWSLAAKDYRVQKVDPLKEIKTAYAAGKGIEVQSSHGVWSRLGTHPSWDLGPERYRIADPYRKFKEAHAAGKRVEAQGPSGTWHRLPSHPRWDIYPEHYRIVETTTTVEGSLLGVIKRMETWDRGAGVDTILDLADELRRIRGD